MSTADWNLNGIYEYPIAADDIVNNPYFFENQKLITASPDLFRNSKYYPSPHDDVFKIHMNVNFALGPCIDGKKFIGPHEPLSTNGQAKFISCDDNVHCTHTRQIPLGSIVEISMTAYNTFAAGNF